MNKDKEEARPSAWRAYFATVAEEKGADSDNGAMAHAQPPCMEVAEARALPASADHDRHAHAITKKLQQKSPILTIRSHSGLAGDMLFAGLAALKLSQLDLEPQSQEAQTWLNTLCAAIMPQLGKAAKLVRLERNGICGWHLQLALPHAHEHRGLDDIQKIITASELGTNGKSLALEAFELLATCEAEVHGKALNEVHFHEVGALDSILDICGCCELYEQLGMPEVTASPLPVDDGRIDCAHGILPAPAPAALKLLQGMSVRPFAGPLCQGELLTPTALALLRVFAVNFGSWPAMRIENTALVYGQRYFSDAPNGVIFVFGHPLQQAGQEASVPAG